MGTYPAIMYEKRIGTVSVRKQGLYYLVSCACKLPEQKIYRLFAETGNNKVDLGILIPENEQFVAETRVVAKAIDLSCVCFVVSERGNNEVFVPVCEGGEFACLDKLRNARFVCKDGMRGILISE